MGAYHMQSIVAAALGHQADIGHHKGARTFGGIAVIVVSIAAGIVAFAVFQVAAGLVILTIPGWLLGAAVITLVIVIFGHLLGRILRSLRLAFIHRITAIDAQLQANQPIGMLRHKFGQIEMKTLFAIARHLG